MVYWIDRVPIPLPGLIIGFTFSMAISRYDQRKDYEEAEANAIGTEEPHGSTASPWLPGC
jgi:hypothetical protein